MECQLCGATMVRTPDKILTTYPAMYEYKCPKCGHIQYQHVEVINSDYAHYVSESLNEKPDPWFEFKCNAAKDILCAMISTDAGYQSILIDNGYQQRIGENVVSNAIYMADELIKQLKEQK